MTDAPSEKWWRSRWLEAIYDSDLTPSQRFIATIYADFANDGRMSWASISTIMHRTGYSRDTVIRARAALSEAGWIVQTTKASRHKAATYALVIPNVKGSDHQTPKDDLGVRQSDASRDLGVRPSDYQGSDDRTTRGPTIRHNKSSTNPLSILSRGQRAAQLYLRCPDDDERLMLISKILKDRDIRNPEGWIKRVAKRGDLEKLIDEQRSNSRSSNRPEGWGAPGPSPDEWPRGTAWGKTFKEPCDNPECDAGWITTDNPDGQPISSRCPDCHPIAS